MLHRALRTELLVGSASSLQLARRRAVIHQQGSVPPRNDTPEPRHFSSLLVHDPLDPANVTAHDAKNKEKDGNRYRKIKRNFKVDSGDRFLVYFCMSGSEEWVS